MLVIVGTIERSSFSNVSNLSSLEPGGVDWFCSLSVLLNATVRTLSSIISAHIGNFTFADAIQLKLLLMSEHTHVCGSGENGVKMEKRKD
jgi:hypothetical protein